MLLTACLLAGACANDPAHPDGGTVGAPTSTAAPERTTRPVPTTTLPDLAASFGLAASIRQFREDEVVGVLQIELVRSREVTELLTVRSVRLAWPGLAPVAPTERMVVVAPGQRVDVPTPLAEATGCGAGDVPSYAGGHVEAVVDGPGDVPVTVEAPLLADAQTAFDNVWGTACRKQRVDRLVGLEFDPAWVRSDDAQGPAATGTLVVTRRAASGFVEIEGVDGSVLLVTDPIRGRLRSMERGTSELRVPVTVRASGRCDGHALGDSKKTYDFQVQFVDVDLVWAAEVTVAPADRAVLASVIADTCAAARSGAGPG